MHRQCAKWLLFRAFDRLNPQVAVDADDVRLRVQVAQREGILALATRLENAGNCASLPAVEETQ